MFCLIIVWMDISRNIVGSWRENKTEKNEEKKTDADDDDRVSTTFEHFLIVSSDDVVNFEYHETSWVIDSGALMSYLKRISLHLI